MEASPTEPGESAKSRRSSPRMSQPASGWGPALPAWDNAPLTATCLSGSELMKGPTSPGRKGGTARRRPPSAGSPDGLRGERQEIDVRARREAAQRPAAKVHRAVEAARDHDIPAAVHRDRFARIVAGAPGGLHPQEGAGRREL